MSKVGVDNSRLSRKEIFIVINPASGERSTEPFYASTVEPLLAEHKGEFAISEYRTESPGDAERIARQIVSSKGRHDDEPIRIICLGGDGTTHEVVNGLVKLSKSGNLLAPAVHLAVIPTGTANALFASLYAKGLGANELYNDKLRSARQLLKAKENAACPLALSVVNTIEGAVGHKRTRVGHLITSHALHASILAESEALRAEHPGIERFKIAAAHNSTKWLDASIDLEALADGRGVQHFDPNSKRFQTVSAPAAGSVHLDGPILYFACLTTDRLEPAFVPAPFSGPFCEDRELRRPPDALDVVVIRPMTSPALKGRQVTEETRESFAKQVLTRVTADMYDEGKHVHLTYSPRGDIEIDGKGPAVCEYYRCAGYQWQPHEEAAHRTCIDGTIVDSQMTTVRALSSSEGAGNITVYR